MHLITVSLVTANVLEFHVIILAVVMVNVTLPTDSAHVSLKPEQDQKQYLTAAVVPW
jgi:hypothetical protein